jgi:hypothetical protein
MVGTPRAIYYFADYEKSETHGRQRITRRHVTVPETIPTCIVVVLTAQIVIVVLLSLYFVFIFLNDGHFCDPFSCGDIHDIRYPFRLQDDPENCGDRNYTLSCENNRTVLYLHAEKYYVRKIITITTQSEW